MLLNIGIDIRELNIFDVGVAGFLLGMGYVDYRIETLYEFFNIEVNYNNFLQNILNISKCHKSIEARFSENKEIEKVFDLEMNILNVVIDMERNGIILDSDYLKDIEGFLEETKSNIKKEIFEDVGHEFNINSPKQVGEVLFSERDLPGGKKTKSGSYSTNERILSKLVGIDPVVSNILKYREIEKLLSTYVKSLPEYIFNEDGRIHSTFDQLGAVSGRFSSKNPNLQNIPTTNSLDMNIREAFKAPEGSIFVAFDYSQQELRILSALAKEESLIESFNMNKDIHKLTASRMFGKEMDDVTKEERDIGKTINFSVVYGISAFGLADRMNLDRGSAQEFIDKYFENYPNIYQYFEDMKKKIDIDKTAKTLLGRMRKVNMAGIKNRFAIGAMERELINFRIQGTAADIMKIAMMNIGKVLDKHPAKLLLQIHDEFLFEYKIKSKVKSQKLEGYDKGFIDFVNEIREIMNGALDIGVMYDVDVAVGERWGSLSEIDIN
ncbi:MAG: DNA polymerase [Candidatus Dojkabacteria bacterium]|nr:DNA polymerase [Candidatus Dojkabacteria bacterium]